MPKPADILKCFCTVKNSNSYKAIKVNETYAALLGKRGSASWMPGVMCPIFPKFHTVLPSQTMCCDMVVSDLTLCSLFALLLQVWTWRRTTLSKMLARCEPLGI